MLKKTLTIFTLALFTLIGLQATNEKETSSQSEQSDQTEKGGCENLTPGLLICHDSEDKCVKDDDESDEKESPSALLFSLLSEQK